MTLILWREGLTEEREAVVLRRLARLGTIHQVVRGGVLAVLDHEVHVLVRSWPEVRLVGAVTVGPRQARSVPRPPAKRNTTRATR